MIEADGIHFGYHPDRPLFTDLSVSVAAGEAVALAGSSGSGKSTLLYLLGTLVRPWQGRLRLGGVEVAGSDDAGRSAVRARLIGFVFQDALLDPRRSVLDNIIEGAVYGGRDRGAAMREARRLMDHFGVQVEASRKATDLSGGQAQRVALCRAMVSHPAIVLADEPTGNLDRGNARIVEDALFRHAADGGAVLMATHDEALASRCHRVIRL